MQNRLLRTVWHMTLDGNSGRQMVNAVHRLDVGEAKP